MFFLEQYGALNRRFIKKKLSVFMLHLKPQPLLVFCFEKSISLFQELLVFINCCSLNVDAEKYWITKPSFSEWNYPWKRTTGIFISAHSSFYLSNLFTSANCLWTFINFQVPSSPIQPNARDAVSVNLMLLRSASSVYACSLYFLLHFSNDLTWFVTSD